jgi:hypothetical protein
MSGSGRPHAAGRRYGIDRMVGNVEHGRFERSLAALAAACALGSGLSQVRLGTTSTANRSISSA